MISRLKNHSVQTTHLQSRLLQKKAIQKGLSHNRTNRTSQLQQRPNPMPNPHIKRHVLQCLKTPMSVLSTKSAAAASIRVWLTKNSYL